MIYEGKAITVKALESGIVELKFDLKGESVNKFNRLTLDELRQAVDAIKADASVKGVIVSSGKDVFIVGADITEFVDNFKLPEAELVAGNLEANRIFNAFEDLEVPTVPPSTASPWAAAWKCAWQPTTGSCPPAPRSACRKSNWASTRASAAPCACHA
jgi:short chain enoyl-CoA hydratase (EC 4.2.1.17)/3-hydroxyacyl-CoA dehydrogenase (EC 1.1.1.35)